MVTVQKATDSCRIFVFGSAMGYKIDAKADKQFRQIFSDAFFRSCRNKVTRTPGRGNPASAVSRDQHAGVRVPPGSFVTKGRFQFEEPAAGRCPFRRAGEPPCRSHRAGAGRFPSAFRTLRRIDQPDTCNDLCAFGVPCSPAHLPLGAARRWREAPFEAPLSRSRPPRLPQDTHSKPCRVNRTFTWPAAPAASHLSPASARSKVHQIPLRAPDRRGSRYRLGDGDLQFAFSQQGLQRRDGIPDRSRRTVSPGMRVYPRGLQHRPGAGDGVRLGQAGELQFCRKALKPGRAGYKPEQFLHV